MPIKEIHIKILLGLLFVILLFTIYFSYNDYKSVQELLANAFCNMLGGLYAGLIIYYLERREKGS